MANTIGETNPTGDSSGDGGFNFSGGSYVYNPNTGQMEWSQQGQSPGGGGGAPIGGNPFAGAAGTTAGGSAVPAATGAAAAGAAGVAASTGGAAAGAGGILGSGVGYLDALKMILGLYGAYQSSKPGSFRQVPQTPEETALHQKMLGYIDNSPTRDFLGGVLDQYSQGKRFSTFDLPTSQGFTPGGPHTVAPYNPNQRPGGLDMHALLDAYRKAILASSSQSPSSSLTPGQSVSPQLPGQPEMPFNRQP